MPINVTDPDGNTVPFADGTPDATINAEMQKRWAARSQPQQPKPTPLTSPNQMPGGTTTVGPSGAGTLSGRIGSNIETGMVGLSEEAQRALNMLQLAGITNNRTMEMAANQILAKDPSYQARKSQAEAMGKTAGARQQMREAGENILDPYERLRIMVEQTPEDELLGAIGPRNQAPLQEQSPTYIPGSRWLGQGIPIPGFSGPTTVDPKSGAPISGNLTTVQRDAILNPNDPKIQAAYNAQNRINHLTDGITTAIMAQVKAGTMTDSKMEMYKDAISRFKNASTRPEAMKILRDAGLLIQNDFSLTPDEFNSITGRHRARHLAEDAETEYKNMQEATKDNKIPDEKLHLLFQNFNNPKHIALFNKQFYGGKPGLAEALIRAHMALATQELMKQGS